MNAAESRMNRSPAQHGARHAHSTSGAREQDGARVLADLDWGASWDADTAVDLAPPRRDVERGAHFDDIDPRGFVS